MVKHDYNFGPFGNYERPSTGHVLNALSHLGVPMHIAESVQFDKDGGMKLNGKPFCKYKYFDGIDQPLFLFFGFNYSQQKMVVQQDSSLHPAFQLSLSSHDTAGLIFDGQEATPELHEFLTSIMSCCDSRDHRYNLRQACGAFFQGGHDRPDGGYFYIEFWNSIGAQAFVDYVNENYKPKSLEQSHVENS